MRLSEAIRLGAMLKPQGYDEYQDEAGGSCALGAAMDAIGIPPFRQTKHLEDAQLAAWFPGIARATVCPRCGDRGEDVGDTVVHLNDDHHWTREAIADWIDTVDPVPAPEVAPKQDSVPV